MRPVVLALHMMLLSTGAYAQTAPAALSHSGGSEAEAAPTQRMVVFALTEKKLIGADGRVLGDIDGVVVSPAQKKQYLVVSRGGFLGYLRTEYAVPINELVVEGSQIVAKSLTETQLESGTSFDEADPTYKPVPVSQTVNIPERR